MPNDPIANPDLERARDTLREILFSDRVPLLRDFPVLRERILTSVLAWGIEQRAEEAERDAGLNTHEDDCTINQLVHRERAAILRRQAGELER